MNSSWPNDPVICSVVQELMEELGADLAHSTGQKWVVHYAHVEQKTRLM